MSWFLTPGNFSIGRVLGSTATARGHKEYDGAVTEVICPSGVTSSRRPFPASTNIHIPVAVKRCRRAENSTVRRPPKPPSPKRPAVVPAIGRNCALASSRRQSDGFCDRQCRVHRSPKQRPWARESGLQRRSIAGRSRNRPRSRHRRDGSLREHSADPNCWSCRKDKRFQHRLRLLPQVSAKKAICGRTSVRAKKKKKEKEQKKKKKKKKKKRKKKKKKKKKEKKRKKKIKKEKKARPSMPANGCESRRRR